MTFFPSPDGSIFNWGGIVMQNSTNLWSRNGSRNSTAWAEPALSILHVCAPGISVLISKSSALFRRLPLDDFTIFPNAFNGLLGPSKQADVAFEKIFSIIFLSLKNPDGIDLILSAKVDLFFSFV